MREMQRRIITFVLEAKIPKPAMAKRIVEMWATELFEGKVEASELFKSQALGKPIKAYATPKPIHARIAQRMLEDGKEIYQGMKIPYVLTGTEDGKQAGVHVDDFDGEYDAQLYWTKQVYPSTQRILKVCFPKNKYDWNLLEDFELGGVRQKDLFVSPAKTNVVPLRLYETDRDKMQEVRDVLDKYPGDRKVRIELNVADATVELLSEVCVSFIPALIMELEKTVDHRVYFGKEDWE